MIWQKGCEPILLNQFLSSDICIGVFKTYISKYVHIFIAYHYVKMSNIFSTAFLHVQFWVQNQLPKSLPGCTKTPACCTSALSIVAKVVRVACVRYLWINYSYSTLEHGLQQDWSDAKGILLNVERERVEICRNVSPMKQPILLFTIFQHLIGWLEFKHWLDLYMQCASLLVKMPDTLLAIHTRVVNMLLAAFWMYSYLLQKTRLLLLHINPWFWYLY